MPVGAGGSRRDQWLPRLPRIHLLAGGHTKRTPALLKWAAAFSAEVGGTLKLLHVVGSVSDWLSIASERALQEQVRQEAQGRIESMQRATGIDAPLRMAVGEVVPTVSSEACQDAADLLVIGRS